MGSGLRRIDNDTRAVRTNKAYYPSDMVVGAYYGFLSSNGAWYIMEENAGAYRYIFGTSDYATNWTNRAGLSYNYYNEG